MLRRNRRSRSKHSLRNFISICLFRQRNYHSLYYQFGMQIIQNPSRKLYTGDEIPYIGFGTYQIRGQECYQAVKHALKVGYTHIDTASIYKNEEEIGRALKDLKVDRSKLFITSKIAPGQQGYKEAKEACFSILKRLNTDYLDLLIIHWPGTSKLAVTSPKNKEVRRQTWRALVQLQKEGKVKNIGVSNFLRHHLQDLLQNSDVKPAINQFQIHPLLWQKDTIEYCRQHDITIEAYSPLARADERLITNKTIQSLAGKYNKSIAQICLRWALQHDFIVLPKSKSNARIAENFKVFDFKLSEEDMKSIDQLTSFNVRTCWDPHSITH